MRLLLLSKDPVSLDELEAKLTQRLPALRVIGKCYKWADGVQAAWQLHPDAVVIGDESQLFDPKKLAQLKVNCKYLLVLISEDVPKPKLGQPACIECYGGLEALLQFLAFILKQ